MGCELWKIKVKELVWKVTYDFDCNSYYYSGGTYCCLFIARNYNYCNDIVNYFFDSRKPQIKEES